MSPCELRRLLQPSIDATLNTLRRELTLQGIYAYPVDDFSADLASVQATVAWAFLIPVDPLVTSPQNDISVGIEVLRSDAHLGEDVPPASVNFEFTVVTVGEEVLCAYQPCKFTTRQWVPLSDWSEVENRYALFASFVEGAADFIADHLRVRSLPRA